MKLKEYMEKNNLTVRGMAELCGIHYSSIYRLTVPKDHKSSRNLTLGTAQKIVNATHGKVTLADLLES
jgi:plasmid maintenance system antidote protein VapI